MLTTVAYSLGVTGGLPLGNYTSAWFENLLLLDMDTAIRQFEGVNYYLRYVDDFISLAANKRRLRKLVGLIVDMLSKIGLKLKDNWQIFKVSDRGIDMLGYRFFYGYVLLRKRNLFALYRTIRNYIKKPCKYWATRFLCRFGGLKWFNSFNLSSWIESKVNILKARALCSGEIR